MNEQCLYPQNPKPHAKVIFIRMEKRYCYQSPEHGANHYGLDTSVKVHFSNAVHNTTMAINLARAVARK